MLTWRGERPAVLLRGEKKEMRSRMRGDNLLRRSTRLVAPDTSSRGTNVAGGLECRMAPGAARSGSAERAPRAPSATRARCEPAEHSHALPALRLAATRRVTHCTGKPTARPRLAQRCPTLPTRTLLIDI